MQNRIGGIILAAGQSRRMGKPKALLEYPGGKTLLAQQFDLLCGSGCAPVVVVVGSNADSIIAAHPQLDVSWCINKDWERGQFSSIRSGLAHLLHEDIDGAVVLPVDTVGVSTATVAALIGAAVKQPGPSAVVPKCGDKGGHPIYLSKNICERIVKIDPSAKNARLDLLLNEFPETAHVEVGDEAILNNVNTSEEWQACSKEYSS